MEQTSLRQVREAHTKKYEHDFDRGLIEAAILPFCSCQSIVRLVFLSFLCSAWAVLPPFTQKPQVMFIFFHFWGKNLAWNFSCKHFSNPRQISKSAPIVSSVVLSSNRGHTLKIITWLWLFVLSSTDSSQLKPCFPVGHKVKRVVKLARPIL